MISLVLSMKDSPEAGEPLSNPIKGLTRLGAVHRRGQLSVVAAASATGKSAYATHFAVNSGVPTMYFSADSDRVTLGTRVAAGVLNQTVTEVEGKLRRNDVEAWGRLGNATEHISWNWNSQPSCSYIYDECKAYAYAQGDWPHLVVVDNLINVEGQEDGHEGKDWIMSQLQRMASEMNAHFLVLHHVVGQFEDGWMPVPKSALIDKVAKRPRLVLTIHKPQPNLMRISVVKNSSGQCDPSGIGVTTDVAWMPELSWMSG